VTSTPEGGPPPRLLEMTGIGKSFGPVRVLDDVRFDLLPGEVHILAGENGAGKSTLVKILAGVHTEFEGTVRVGGERVRFSGPPDAAARGISVIHQELSLIPDMSVADNVFLGRELHGRLGWMHGREQERRCAHLVAELGLDVDPRRPVGSYPISVQQAIEIAKALAFEARIIIMDEPTSALTEPEVARLFGIVDGLKARGCGVIYISHKMEEVYRIADRITVLRDGRHVATAPASEMPRRDLLRFMVGREVGEQFPARSAAFGPERLRLERFSVPSADGRGRPAVDGVSVSVRSGEILGIGGLQGSGASDLLNGLFGAYGARTTGAVRLDGRPFRPESPGASIRQGVALLTSDRKANGLVLGMSVTRNITLPSARKYSPWGWFLQGREYACACRHRDALRIRVASVNAPVASLSGGNQQKVVLAKWLETTPRALLLDEPTRGVDVGAKHEIYELIRRCTAEGMAVMLITSELPELLALSDRILVMHRGRRTALLDADQATPEAVLHAAMGGELQGAVGDAAAGNESEGN